MTRRCPSVWPGPAAPTHGTTHMFDFIGKHKRAVQIVLALAVCMPELRSMDKPDFEKLLPIVLTQYVPTGVVGFLFVFCRWRNNLKKPAHFHA